MRYHLKEDGNPGVCTAEPGKCPKGDAIHGESVQEIYSQLEKVMEKQLFSEKSKPFEPTKPRLSARELGSAGMLVHQRQPFVVQQQLEGLRELGIIDQALPTLDAHQPWAAGAVRANLETSIDFDVLYERPVDFSYEGSDGHLYTSQTDTWVAHSSYELQTVALNHLMDKLENGELEGTNLKALSKALGHIKPPAEYPDNQKDTYRDSSSFSFDYLGFNYNPDRQPDDFYNNVKNRLVEEGFDKKKIAENKHQYTVPGFLWKGLDQAAKERFATNLLAKDHRPSSYGMKSYKDRVLGREFGEIMSATFAPNDGLSRRSGDPEGKPTNFVIDYNGSTSTGLFKFTDGGFEWTEQERKYAEEPKPNRW